MKKLFLLALCPLVALVIACASNVQAALPQTQATVINPKFVDFPASPDHDLKAPVSNVDLVSNYRLDIYDGTTLAKQVTVPKQVPVSVGGVPTIVGVPLASTGLQQNKVYTLSPVVVGPGGEARYATSSGPFAWETVTAPRAGAGSVTVR